MRLSIVVFTNKEISSSFSVNPFCSRTRDACSSATDGITVGGSNTPTHPQCQYSRQVVHSTVGYMHVIALEYFIGNSVPTPANLRPMQRRYKPTTNKLERRRLCLIRVVHRCRLTSRRLNRNSMHLLLHVFSCFCTLFCQYVCIMFFCYRWPATMANASTGSLSL